MKKILLPAFLMILFFTRSLGQAAAVKSGSTIPTFRMLLTNGQYFSSSQIQKNRPVVLIYFAPDCDHCLVLMDQLFKKIHQLDKASVVMITFKSPQEIIGFEKKYNTSKYPNIKVGTEGTTYVVRNFYRLEKTPFTAVYDRKGVLAFSYKEETPVPEMLARLKKL
jgi:peroxiredoxin